VEELHLSAEDFREVVRACRHLRLWECTSAIFHYLLVVRLGESGRADLAGRVAALDAGQVEALCRRVREEQELYEQPSGVGRRGGGPAAGPRPG